jgi:hypothetical protein
MNYGYSMRLGTHIYASALDYPDCRKYMICCPACREQVFKGVRRRSDGSEHHYLSHYRHDMAAAADCEMRVEGMSVSVSGSLEHASRGQRLEDFVELLNGLIEHDSVTFCPDDPDEEECQRTLTEAVYETKFLMELADDLAGSGAAEGLFLNPMEFEEQARHYAKGAESPFGVTQIRTAADVWRHVLTPPARENFRRLFSRAYTVLHSRLDATFESRKVTYEEELLVNALMQLPQQNDEDGDLTLKLMRGFPVDEVYGVEAGDLLEALRFHLVEEMIGVLLRLPYEEVLQEEDLEEVLPLAGAIWSPPEIEQKVERYFGIEDFTPKELEEAVLQCVPRKGHVAREALLRKTVKFLEVEGSRRKARSQINKAIFRQARAGLLQLNSSNELVWLADGELGVPKQL